MIITNTEVTNGATIVVANINAADAQCIVRAMYNGGSFTIPHRVFITVGDECKTDTPKSEKLARVTNLRYDDRTVIGELDMSEGLSSHINNGVLKHRAVITGEDHKLTLSHLSLKLEA